MTPEPLTPAELAWAEKAAECVGLRQQLADAERERDEALAKLVRTEELLKESLDITDTVQATADATVAKNKAMELHLRGYQRSFPLVEKRAEEAERNTEQMKTAWRMAAARAESAEDRVRALEGALLALAYASDTDGPCWCWESVHEEDCLKARAALALTPLEGKIVLCGAPYNCTRQVGHDGPHVDGREVLAEPPAGPVADGGEPVWCRDCNDAVDNRDKPLCANCICGLGYERAHEERDSLKAQLAEARKERDVALESYDCIGRVWQALRGDATPTAADQYPLVPAVRALRADLERVTAERDEWRELADKSLLAGMCLKRERDSLQRRLDGCVKALEEACDPVTAYDHHDRPLSAEWLKQVIAQALAAAREGGGGNG